MTRDASLRAGASFGRSDSSAFDCLASSPQQNMYGGSQKTAQSEPRKWSNCSNQNTTAKLDPSVIDARPSGSQICSAFSAEDEINYQSSAILPSLEQELQSSNGDDYQPVIDDLTVELQKLRNELKLYKAQGPCLLRNEQLFEIKINNLPDRKKRELEAALSIFTSNLGNSIAPHPRKSGRRVNILSGSSLEHLSPSSNSKTQPQDSAYGSMSGDHSCGEISPGQSTGMQRTWSAKRKVERYLCNIPEDLCQSRVAMTDQESSGWMDGCDSKMTRKHRQKTQRLERCMGDSRTVSKEPKVEPHFPNSSNRFHYKPLFVHQDSPDSAAQLGDALSSFGSDDGSIGEIGNTRKGSRYSKSPQKRCAGTIIYYIDAPFCIDLSGDPSDWSPAEYIACNVQNATESSVLPSCRHSSPYLSTSDLGSWLPNDPRPLARSELIMEVDEKDPLGFPEEYAEETNDAEFEFHWTEEQQQCLEVQPLEPCGLGNVQPDDHFTISVTTSRAKRDASCIRPKTEQGDWAKSTDARLGIVLASSPALQLLHHLWWGNSPGGVRIEYMDERTTHSIPVSLPPPIMFFQNPSHRSVDSSSYSSPCSCSYVTPTV